MPARPHARPRRPVLLALAALAVAACTSASPSAPPSSAASTAPGATASALPSTPPPSAASSAPGATASPPAGSPLPSSRPAASAAAAFAAVRARSPYFDAVQPRDPQMVGQAAWWTATPAGPGTGGAWEVTVSVGWGDCPAGCISNHVWRWAVAADGATTLESESGPTIPQDVQAGLAAAATSSGVGGAVTAGPVCPVVRPGESGCDDRPVGDAVLVVSDAGGAQVARFTTDGSGLFRIALAPDSYTLEPQPRAGLLGTARPEPFTVAPGRLTLLPVSYDTGIR